MEKRINVVGLGYIGLPTALMMAANGKTVVGTDIDEKRISSLRYGEVPFDEDGLRDVFKRAQNNGIEFSTSCVKADVYIISVPTPYDKENKKLDPGFVIAAAKSVLQVCSGEAIMAIESTIAPGTIDRYIRPLIAGNAISNWLMCQRGSYLEA